MTAAHGQRRTPGFRAPASAGRAARARRRATTQADASLPPRCGATRATPVDVSSSHVESPPARRPRAARPTARAPNETHPPEPAPQDSSLSFLVKDPTASVPRTRRRQCQCQGPDSVSSQHPTASVAKDPTASVPRTRPRQFQECRVRPMNIVGLGLDATEVDRIAQSLARYGERFLQRVFTEQEIAYCMRRRNPAPHLAGRFAAKEAGMKAIGTGHALRRAVARSRGGAAWRSPATEVSQRRRPSFRATRGHKSPADHHSHGLSRPCARDSRVRRRQPQLALRSARPACALARGATSFSHLL